MIVCSCNVITLDSIKTAIKMDSTQVPSRWWLRPALFIANSDFARNAAPACGALQN